VRDLERQLAALPLSIISDREEKRLQARLKDANRQLAEMEDRLKTAQAAVDAARKAI
jgi:hypothetical protein